MPTYLDRRSWLALVATTIAARSIDASHRMTLWIKRWCKRKSLKRGEVLSIDQVWELSKLWYQDRLSLDYRGRSIEQVAEIFKQAGLTSKFLYV